MNAKRARNFKEVFIAGGRAVGAVLFFGLCDAPKWDPPFALSGPCLAGYSDTCHVFSRIARMQAKYEPAGFGIVGVLDQFFQYRETRFVPVPKIVGN